MMKDAADPMPTDRAVQSVRVFPAGAVRVVNGANLGDPLGCAEDLLAGDVYALAHDAAPLRLSLAAGDQHFAVAADSEAGREGAPIYLDSALVLMPPRGEVVEALVLAETDAEGHLAMVYLMPLSPMAPRTDYALVGIDRDGAARLFAQTACVSFTRGTRITLATGAQAPIEDLRPGDRVLTRDNGAQEVRWVGQSTVRAAGAVAPILIRAGVLNNDRDLLVSPDHRLFVYQRTDRLGAGRPELLVRARHLVNGDGVRVREGGFVDYFQLLFDSHQIVYAEGIAAESMLIDPRTRPALPPALADRLGELLPGHRDGARDLDVQRALLDRPDAVEILRRASLR